jgi:tRNA (adenine57-N1/adenine58-N1)-methyltransferase
MYAELCCTNIFIEIDNHNFLVPLQDWIGKPFGSKVLSKAPGSGWVWLLAPNPELWTIALKHRW